MSATTQELENDIAQMEDRLANVKVVVEVEREAWRRSSHTGRRGTKWKGAAASHSKENDPSSSSRSSANNSPSDKTEEDITIMPGYWDALELAQYLKTKQLGSYAQVVVGEQITGKMLLDTPAPKLRKLFENVEFSSNAWKMLQNEYVKLKKHQRRLEKAVDTTRSQPGSSRSLDSALEASDRQPSPSTIISTAGATVVFPLISPRVSATLAPNVSNQARQQTTTRLPITSRPTFPMRKPASSNSIPLSTCWNCKTRFLRPHSKRPAANRNQPVSSSMRASLVARAYCSKECQESIESSDIRISPSLSARVQVTFGCLNSASGDTTKHSRPSRIATGLASISSSSSDLLDPDLLTRSDSITVSHLGCSVDVSSNNPPAPRSKRLRKSKTFDRRRSRPDASLDDPNSFDFLQVAAPKRENAISTLASPRQNCTEGPSPVAAAVGIRSIYRPPDVKVPTTFTISPSVTSLAVSSYRSTATVCVSPNGKPMRPVMILNNTNSQGAPKQSKVYQKSKYKLDPDLYQAHSETFSSCFGAIKSNNRGTRADHGRGNLLRLQEFLTVRALHRLSLTSRVWFDLITVPSLISDALWGVHVLRIWRPSGEDEDFLRSIGVLQKPERPRRVLQILTRQVSRVTVENMKVLLNSESWQLAAVMIPKEGEKFLSLQNVMTRKRGLVPRDEGELTPRRQTPVELYEHITAIYSRAGDIVAICARQLIRPVDPMALLTDILQGLKCGELMTVHCRRLRLFSQTNRLPCDQWALLSQCSRVVVEFFWSESDDTVLSLVPVWHQKILSKLQYGLQQRLLGKDSINSVMKTAHDQCTPPAMLLSLEKFLARCHT
ncbi:hypothetical protein PHMEG_000791 [Phytophthora megakarya]|uniref:SAM domain-containing protein n=1 Tax=Phytophthora megakarya TaxID=4795 RepID=A0A225X2R8_9STRA|nr:hypothetical protein PHMEG_000791 [Phytophthora megakarya]